MAKENNSTNLYTPGVCNIGKEEINKRRKLLAIAGVALIIFTFFCFEYEDSAWIKALLFVFACVISILYLEVRQKFCITFGMMGYFNFGKVGKAEKVKDEKFRDRDKKKALKIILQSLMLALLFMLFITFLFKLLR